jgi:hypothetical protein
MTQGRQERIYALQPPTAKGKATLSPGSDDIPALSIAPRESDTRHINAAHAVDLAESIAVLGLLQPLGVDTAGQLLIGGHRLAALQLLLEPAPTARRAAFLVQCGHPDAEKLPEDLTKLADRLAALGDDPLGDSPLKAKVPVQVLDVTGKNGEGLALAVEAAENNLRRQYTAKEIKTLAKRFEAAGYKTTVGNPKAGEKTKLNMLAAAVGKSKRQIQRILANPDKSKKGSAFEKAKESLRRAAARVVKTGEKKNEGRHKLSEEDQAVVALAAKVGKALSG